MSVMFVEEMLRCVEGSAEAREEREDSTEKRGYLRVLREKWEIVTINRDVVEDGERDKREQLREASVLSEEGTKEVVLMVRFP